jgi:hypothetical protein
MQHDIRISFKFNRNEILTFLLTFWIAFILLAIVNVEVQIRELEAPYCNLPQIIS